VRKTSVTPVEKAAVNTQIPAAHNLLTQHRADLSTANDLWQPPRFPTLHPPASTDSAPEISYFLPRSSQPDHERLQYTLSSSLSLSSKPNIDTVVENLKSFAAELEDITRSISPLKRPRLEISDRIHLFERQIFDLIHSPPLPQNALDHAFAIAALIYMRSYLRDTICSFRIVETARLQIALQSLMELNDWWAYAQEMRSREKLLWTMGFGAVSSAGGPERPWFVRLFRELCYMLDLKRWESVKAMFKTVLWKDELDKNGATLWEEKQMI
jgi:hypothetical protein